MNATKLGFFATKHKPLPDDDPQFKRDHRALRRHIKPVNVLESEMVRELSYALWLKRRALGGADEIAPDSFARIYASFDHCAHRAFNALRLLLSGKLGPRAHNIDVFWVPKQDFYKPPHKRRRYLQAKSCENDPEQNADPKSLNSPAPVLEPPSEPTHEPAEIPSVDPHPPAAAQCQPPAALQQPAAPMTRLPELGSDPPAGQPRSAESGNSPGRAPKSSANGDSVIYPLADCKI
jgi:hypothetical protein